MLSYLSLYVILVKCADVCIRCVRFYTYMKQGNVFKYGANALSVEHWAGNYAEK